MGFNTKGLTVFNRVWFSGNPVNAVKASATLSFEGVVVAAETVTINGQVYEFVAAAEDIAVATNIPCVVGVTLTADNAVTVLAAAINANSDIVTAVANTTTDTVVITAIAGGTGANALAIATDETNASFGGGVTTLSGGLNTCTAADGAACIVNAINTNTSEVVSAVVGVDGSSAVISYKLVGTDGNTVGVSTTAANGDFGAEVTTLSGGIFATPCNASAAVIVIDNAIYFTDKPCTKYTQNAWYLATPTLV